MYLRMNDEELIAIHLQKERERLISESIAKGRAETRFEAIDKFVADGIYDAERACEILGVSVEE